jgi:hypothetical protein
MSSEAGTFRHISALLARCFTCSLIAVRPICPSSQRYCRQQAMAHPLGTTRLNQAPQARCRVIRTRCATVAANCDNGVVYTDVFTVGQLALVGMPILAMTSSSTPSNGISSGVLGMNFDKNGMTTSPNRLQTYFATIMPYLDGKFTFS